MNEAQKVQEAVLHAGDAHEVLRSFLSDSFQTCVTSPPYWGLRDYEHEGQVGLEPTLEEYIEKLVVIFREVRRVLSKSGTLWLNLGDAYNAYNGNRGPSKGAVNRRSHKIMPSLPKGHGLTVPSLKVKDLLGIPWRVAFALQQDGWFLRQDIIWHKPNPSPESVRDRCTKAHEYIFLLTKSDRYFYDAEIVFEEGASGSPRNKHSVWSVPTRPFRAAHFATFPPQLVEPCVLAGSKPGDTVLDPFNGAGTTGVVALQHGRRYVGIDVNPNYLAITRSRLSASDADRTSAR